MALSWIVIIVFASSAAIILSLDLVGDALGQRDRALAAASTMTAAACAVALGWRARRSENAPAWWLLCAGIASAGLGEAAVWIIGSSFQHEMFTISFADVPDLVSYVLVAAGFLVAFLRVPGLTNVLRLGLDVAAASTATLAVLWLIVVRDALAAIESMSVKAIAFAHPAFAVVMVALLLLLIVEAPSTQRPRIGLLGLGMTAFMATHLIHIVGFSQPLQEWNVVAEIAWIAGYLCFAGTALVKPWLTTDDSVRTTGTMGQTLMVYAASVVLIPVALVDYRGTQSMDPVLFGLGIMLVSSLIGRQVLYSRELIDSHDALARRERQLVAAQGIAKLGSWELDHGTGSLTWSAEVYRIFEVDPSARPKANQRLIDAIHPEDRERAEALYWTAPGENGLPPVDHRIIVPGGRLKHVRAATRRVRDGRRQLTVGTIQDVTETINAQHHLRLQSDLLSAVRQAVTATDVTGRITYWNDSAERLYGWSHAEAIGRPASSVWGRQQTIEEVTQVDAPGQSSGDYWITRKDGSKVLVNMATSPLLQPDGSLQGFIAIAQDVTERRAAQQEYREIVEFSPVGIMRTTPEGRLDYTNPAGAEILGYDSPEDLLSSVARVTSLYANPADRKILLGELEKVRPGPLETRFRRKDGSLVWVEIRARMHMRPDGSRWIEGTVEDMTAWRTQRELNTRLAAIVDATHDAILSTDLDCVVTTWNRGSSRIFGYATAQAVGRPLFDLMFLPGQGDELRPKILGAIRDGRRFVSTEVAARDASGRGLVVSFSAAPLVDADGTVIGSSVVMQDVTERRIAEKTQRENERIKQVDRTLREFINAAAHDLNTPLTPLKVQLSIIRRIGQELPEMVKESLSVVQRNVDRMALLVQDLLDVARLESGTLKISPAKVPVEHLFKESIATFHDAAAEKGLEIGQVAGSIEVFADERRTIQVLFNLVGNAVKFTPAGGRIDLRARSENGFVRIEVEDTGRGLTPEQMEKLFRPFVQVHVETAGVPKGTGLGLHISKGIVEKHGGSIGVDSPGPGKGTTFWFTLPKTGPQPAGGSAGEVPSSLSPVAADS